MAGALCRISTTFCAGRMVRVGYLKWPNFHNANMSQSASSIQIVSASENLTLRHTFLDADMCYLRDHFTIGSWPRFICEAKVFNDYSPILWKDPVLCRWQFQAIASQAGVGGEQEDEVIATGSSVPFYWATPHDPSSLPDGGWDEVLKTAVDHHLSRDPLQLKVNALCILEITIKDEYRQKSAEIDVAAEMFVKMRSAAAEAGLKVLALPVRPTMKCHGTDVWMEMGRYCSLTKGRGNEKELSQGAENDLVTWPKGSEPHDPWIRRHIRMGGQVVKVCPSSYTVQGTIAEWEEWTGVDFSVPSVNPSKQAGPQGGDRKGFYQVVVPGGLVPVKVYPAKNVGVYVEPNLWVLHKPYTTISESVLQRSN